MSSLQNYQKGKRVQITFDDGNRALLSYGATDMRLFKLGFLSLPKGTIHTFNSGFLYNLNSKIGYDFSKDVVKILGEKLSEAKSTEEVKNFCIQLESDDNFIKQI